MTKKHFDALAAALKASRPSDIHDLDRGWQWQSDVSAIATVCARFNPTFDRARCLAACGVQED